MAKTKKQIKNNKKTKKKIKGGGLLGKQLYNFFQASYLFVDDSTNTGVDENIKDAEGKSENVTLEIINEKLREDGFYPLYYQTPKKPEELSLKEKSKNIIKSIGTSITKTQNYFKGKGTTSNNIENLESIVPNDTLTNINQSPEINNPEEMIERLFTDTFKVYFNIVTGQTVVCNTGSRSTLTDLGANNVRNMFFNKNDFLKTKRNEIAENGNAALVEYFLKCYTDNKNDSEKNKIPTIDDINSLIKINSTDMEKYIYAHIDLAKKTFILKELVEKDNIKPYILINIYFLNKLTTIGHSQGAVYAYLYGNIGNEIITYNPAPFTGEKPYNVYDIKVKGDIVSAAIGKNDKKMHSTYEFETDKNDTLLNKHKYTKLFSDYPTLFFGSKELGSIDNYKNKIDKNLQDQNNDKEDSDLQVKDSNIITCKDDKTCNVKPKISEKIKKFFSFTRYNSGGKKTNNRKTRKRKVKRNQDKQKIRINLKINEQEPTQN